MPRLRERVQRENTRTRRRVCRANDARRLRRPVVALRLDLRFARSGALAASTKLGGPPRAEAEGRARGAVTRRTATRGIKMIEEQWREFAWRRADENVPFGAE